MNGGISCKIGECSLTSWPNYKLIKQKCLLINKMEYQRKKKQIISTVEYTNLLSFALVQNKLEKNFKSIVQALLLTQQEGTQLKEDFNTLAKSSHRQMGLLNDRLSQMEKKFQEMLAKEATRDSLKKLDDAEENKIERKSIHGLSQPKVNINFIKSAKNTEQHIPSEKAISNKSTRNLQAQVEELREKVNKLLGEHVDPAEMDKKLANMKDSINLLKAEVKVMADREAKSAKRVSLGAIQKVDPAPNSFSEKSSQEIKAMSALSGIQQEMEKQINNLHIEMNTMKLCLQEMKEAQGQLRRRDNKSHIQLDELTKNQKKLDERVQNANDSFQAQIKEIKLEMLNLQTKSQEDSQITSKKSRKNIDIKQNLSPNANNQINDKISKLQAMIQGLVTESEFKRLKSQVKDKLSSLESQNQNIRKQLKEEVQMLTEILDTKEEQIAAIQRDIEQLKSKTNDMSSNCERKNNIAISRNEELKKNLQNLREDLQFYKSMNQPTNQVKVVTQPGTDNSEDRKQKSEDTGKSAEELKKYLNRKLHDQRTYLLGLIRDLEKKSGGGKTNMEQDLANFWDKLAEINLFLNKKANEDDVKKSLTYYQKKLANIYQRINSSDQNNQDARIAKTNWFCLSCDKNLHNYQGKVGQHIVWDSMPIKPGHAKFYKEDKKSLPTLKR